MGDDDCLSVTVRCCNIDSWTAGFLAAHLSATVVHLACGLDARCLRFERGPDVRCIDVDLPYAVELWNRLFLATIGGDYALVAGSATDTDA